jgi:hypothetical protein
MLEIGKRIQQNPELAKYPFADNTIDPRFKNGGPLMPTGYQTFIL